MHVNLVRDHSRVRVRTVKKHSDCTSLQFDEKQNHHQLDVTVAVVTSKTVTSDGIQDLRKLRGLLFLEKRLPREYAVSFSSISDSSVTTDCGLKAYRSALSVEGRPRLPLTSQHSYTTTPSNRRCRDWKRVRASGPASHLSTVLVKRHASTLADSFFPAVAGFWM